MKFAFVGGGKMGSALVRGLLGSGHPPSVIGVADSYAPARAALAVLLPKSSIFADPSAMLEAGGDLVVLAVKPQQMADTIAGCRGSLLARPRTAIVSIAAGVGSVRLTELIAAPHGSRLEVVRAMPNSPALVGRGVTVIASGPASKNARGAAAELFATVGSVFEMDEDKLDAVTALSGSGPAYFFRLMAAMASWGTRNGLSPDLAAELSWRTAHGACELLVSSSSLHFGSFAKEVAAVASPGGTTEAALKSIDLDGFDALVDRAMSAAFLRAQELGS